MSDKDAIDRLGVIESYCCAFLELTIGYSIRMQELQPATVKDLLSATDWSKETALYQMQRLPRPLLEELECLQSWLDFELRVEGKIISPSWLRDEFIARAMARSIDKGVGALVSQFEVMFVEAVRTLLPMKRYLMAAQIVQRGLEASAKLERCITQLHTVHSHYVALNRSKEYQWPTIDWQALQDRVTRARREMTLALGASAKHLMPAVEQGLPDLAGQAYAILAEECLEAMLRGDEELFGKVFPRLFDLALRAGEKLRKKLLSLDPQSIELSGEPLVDLMELSGYAAIFSELEGKRFSKIVEAEWDACLAKIQDKRQIEDFMSLLCTLVYPTGRMKPRSLIRTTWKQKVAWVLRKAGVLPERGSYYGRHQNNRSRHSSPVVRAFTDGPGFRDIAIYGSHGSSALLILRSPCWRNPVLAEASVKHRTPTLA